MNNVMHQNWRELLANWAVEPVLADESFKELSRHYSDPGRFYHTLEHIQNVIETVESLRCHAQNFHAIKLAAWLHDVIYDSKASDNEEQSAEFSQALCEKLSIPDGPSVAALILKTKTHDPNDNLDAQVLIDADLAILGAIESAYRTYAENIRREYDWVPEPEYRTGRRRVLERFLAKPKIYRFLSHLEDSARHNITAELALRVGASCSR